MSITKTIPSVSPYSGVIPDKTTQTKIEFANSVHPYLSYINATFVPETNSMITIINNWTTEANALSTTVNQYLNQTISAKNDAISAKNDVIVYRDEIQNYAVSIDMETIKNEITTFTDDKESQIVDALNATVNDVYSETNKNIRKMKMQSFGLGL